ncbi:Disease resistance protein RPM1 [Morus notabilis]|uniref:Disease resistance protein RPM1 n=1 Tax=Morus notabilis TaxID=981085 RepID=W9QYI8_9ROSA|nr:Disease resistance protein RPM1 [Morus notabilis]
MGGLGNTTLTQQVYNHAKARFQCHAWVQVPQPYKREEIQRTLIMELLESTRSSVPGEIHTMDEGKLTNKLREYLKENKYLVIFDDV